MSDLPSNKGYVVTYTKYNRTMKSILYGEVTPERIAAAKAELIHRAEQLFSPAPVKSTFRQSTGTHNSDWEYDDDDFDNGNEDYD